MYQGDYICKDEYISETEHDVVTRWGEHNNLTHDSKPGHHLKNQLNLSFSWFITANALNNTQTQKNLEVTYIALKRRPSSMIKLNIVLFRHGIKWS